MKSSEFDQYAGDYESALQQGLSVSGESAEYFARARMKWLAKRLLSMHFPLKESVAVDFGCGTGNSVEYLLSVLRCSHVVGLDTSEDSLEVARGRYDARTVFMMPQYFSETSVDLVYCNGVFHHIPIAERGSAVGSIFRMLRPGGCFAFWENNPWNPGTRYVMSRIPFDRDAVTLSIPTARELLSNAGLKIACTDSCFYLPRSLGWLRWMEPLLCKLPLGAQYLILAFKPDEGTLL